jgi:hypothetical protein
MIAFRAPHFSGGVLIELGCMLSITFIRLISQGTYVFVRQLFSSVTTAFIEFGFQSSYIFLECPAGLWSVLMGKT